MACATWQLARHCVSEANQKIAISNAEQPRTQDQSAYAFQKSCDVIRYIPTTHVVYSPWRHYRRNIQICAAPALNKLFNPRNDLTCNTVKQKQAKKT